MPPHEFFVKERKLRTSGPSCKRVCHFFCNDHLLYYDFYYRYKANNLYWQAGTRNSLKWRWAAQFCPKQFCPKVLLFCWWPQVPCVGSPPFSCWATPSDAPFPTSISCCVKQRCLHSMHRELQQQLLKKTKNKKDQGSFPPELFAVRQHKHINSMSQVDPLKAHLQQCWSAGLADASWNSLQPQNNPAHTTASFPACDPQGQEGQEHGWQLTSGHQIWWWFNFL